MPGHQHHHFIHLNLNRELSELYVTMALHAFAMGLIGIFIPVYLMGLGYPLKEIFLFYIVAFLSYFIVAAPIMKIISKIGIKHSILLSSWIWIVAFTGLYLLETMAWVYLFIPVLFGVYWSFFWLAYHTDFAQNTEKIHRGEEVGIVNVIIALLSVIAPAVGGLIITFTGFQLVFVVAAILVILSSLPLFLTKEIYPPFDYKMEEQFFLGHPKSVIGFIGQGGEKAGAMRVIWPLFIFTSLATVLSVGSVTSIALIFGLVATFIIGKFSDISDKKVLTKIGTLLHSLSWAAKLFVGNLLSFLVVDSLSRITHSLAVIPREALEYDKASEFDIPSAMVAREMSIALGAAFFFALMFLFPNLLFGLILGALFTLLYFAI
jgi:MFS family permease